MTAQYDELEAKVLEARRALHKAEQELLAYLQTTVPYEVGEEVEVYGNWGVGTNRKLVWRPARLHGWSFATWGQIKAEPTYHAAMKRKDGSWGNDRKSYRPAQVRKVAREETG